MITMFGMQWTKNLLALILFYKIGKVCLMENSNNNNQKMNKITFAMRSGIQQNNILNYKTFSLPNEVTNFCDSIYTIADDQDKKLGDKFSAKPILEILEPFYGEIEAKKEEWWPKIKWLIKILKENYIDTINAKIQLFFADGKFWQNQSWAMTFLRQRMRTFKLMMEKNVFQNKIEILIEQLNRIGIKVTDETPKDLITKINVYLRLIHEQWHNISPNSQFLIITEISKLTVVEENRIILARLQALARNLIRKMLKRENVAILNQLNKYVEEQNYNNTFIVIEHVNEFDQLHKQWTKNLKELEKSNFSYFDENGEKSIFVMDTMDGMEYEMRNYDVEFPSQIINLALIGPNDLPPLNDEQIKNAFKLVKQTVVQGSACPEPLDVFAFYANCWIESDQYRYIGQIEQANLFSKFCTRLRDTVIADALIDEMEMYEQRVTKGTHAYPCAMVKVISKLRASASHDQQESIELKVLNPIKYKKYLEFCLNNVKPETH